MDNARMIIRSSIISFVIVAVGLFVLCVSRAPKINTDDSAVSGGSQSGNWGNEEQALLSLLDEADGELGSNDDASPTESSVQGNQNNTNEDDALASLLSEGEQSFSTDDLAEDSNAGMDELMNLLQTDQPQQTSEEELLLLTQSAQAYSENEFGPIEPSNETTKSQNTKAYTNFADQINYLENVLEEKSTEKQKLEKEIQRYDQQIAQFENKGNQAGSGFTMKKASFVEESGSHINSDFANDYKPISNDDFEISYQDALQLFHENRYNDSANQFYQLLQINPKHKLADNCQYWIGECRYAQGYYHQAIVEFTKVSAFDAADKKDDAQLMLGLCFMKLGEKQSAHSELNWFVSTFASSEYINKAFQYLKQF